jgi:predicted nucleic acid-binding Zn finger protein
MSSDKLNSILSEKRVKLHHFKPSNRKIWTIVGTTKEYWVDPDLEFCSCPGYYFSILDGKNRCYHLESLKIAMKQNKMETIDFLDSEYEDFMKVLLTEL